MAWTPKDKIYLEKSGVISEGLSTNLLIPIDSFQLYHQFSSEESNKITPVHVNLVSTLILYLPLHLCFSTVTCKVLLNRPQCY